MYSVLHWPLTAILKQASTNNTVTQSCKKATIKFPGSFKPSANIQGKNAWHTMDVTRNHRGSSDKKNILLLRISNTLININNFLNTSTKNSAIQIVTQYFYNQANTNITAHQENIRNVFNKELRSKRKDLSMST